MCKTAYLHAGRMAARARNRGDEADYLHWRAHFRTLRSLEPADRRAAVTNLYLAAYHTARPV